MPTTYDATQGDEEAGQGMQKYISQGLLHL